MSRSLASGKKVRGDAVSEFIVLYLVRLYEDSSLLHGCPGL